MPGQVTETSQPTPSHSLPALSLAALGVVFGDIGTSPLYALKAVLDVTKENPPAAILGPCPSNPRDERIESKPIYGRTNVAHFGSVRFHLFQFSRACMITESGS